MMSLRGLFVTATIVFLAGFGGVWAGTHVFDAPRPGMHEVLHERLQLTPEQNAQLEFLEREFDVSRVSLEAEMRAANAELATAIREEHSFGPRVTTAVGRFHDAMGRLQTETIRHMFAMREILNSEQQIIFDDVVVSALTPSGNE